MVEAVILDVDGTLVDSNYQHAIAWDRALASHGAFVELWRVHRHIGMGGEKIVAELAGDDVERRSGDEVRASESEFYASLMDEIRVIEGARELISELGRRGVEVVLASSAPEREVERYVEMLDAGDSARWTSSDDVDRSKPDPDLVEAALGQAGTRNAVMVGDTVWDLEAAERAGIPAIGVLTGGFSRSELSEAGAIEVYESVMGFADDLDAALSR